MSFKPIRERDLEHEFVYEHPDFQKLLRYSIDQEIQVAQVDSLVQHAIFKIEKLYWRVDDAYVFRTKNKAKTVTCQQIYHHALHHMLAERWGSKLTGRPLTVLLFEALASTSDIYFFLHAMRHKLDGTTRAYLTDCYRQSSEILTRTPAQAKKRLLGLLKESLADPFDAFRKTALGLFELQRMLLEIAIRRKSGEKIDFEETYEKIASLKYAPLFFHYDFPTHVSYAMNFGGESSADDLTTVNACIDTLTHATTFEAYVTEIIGATGEKIAA